MAILLITGGLALCFKKHDTKQETAVEETTNTPLYILSPNRDERLSSVSVLSSTKTSFHKG